MKLMIFIANLKKNIQPDKSQTSMLSNGDRLVRILLSPFLMLLSGSIEMDFVIVLSESFYKGTILQKYYFMVIFL